MTNPKAGVLCRTFGHSWKRHIAGRVSHWVAWSTCRWCKAEGLLSRGPNLGELARRPLSEDRMSEAYLRPMAERLMDTWR